MGREDESTIIAIPMGSGGGMAVPQMAPQGKAEILDKIKPEAMVEIIRHRLLGEEYLNNKWTPVKALEKKRLTDQGAWEIANLMLGVSSINISISKLTDREIKERAFRIAKTAQYLLITNWKEYGITNTSQFRYVHEILFSNTLAVLKQADEASIQELLKVIVYEQRNVNPVAKSDKSGKISRMLGFSD